jgi:hypothetical protein
MGKAKPSMARIFMTPPSMAISWTSTMPAAGDLALINLASCVDCNFINAPVAFCWGTVARTQGSDTVTWADAAKEAKAKEIKNVKRFMKILRLSVGTQDQTI